MNCYRRFDTDNYYFRFQDGFMVEINPHKINHVNNASIWFAAADERQKADKFGVKWMQLYYEERARLCPASS